MSIALSDEEIGLLFTQGELPAHPGYLDIKHFLAQVSTALKTKPPSFMGKTKSAASTTHYETKSAAFENWEAEKKYKRKLEALKSQIEEGKKEIIAAEKKIKHWQEVANKYEREKNALSARLVDQNSKPPKTAAFESLTQQQTEELKSLKDKVFYLQDENHKLNHTI